MEREMKKNYLTYKCQKMLLYLSVRDYWAFAVVMESTVMLLRKEGNDAGIILELIRLYREANKEWDSE